MSTTQPKRQFEPTTDNRRGLAEPQGVDRSLPQGTARKEGGAWWLLLLMPVVCCGGPLIVGGIAAAGVVGWGILGGVVAAAIGVAVAVASGRSRAARCCVPERQRSAKEGSRYQGQELVRR